MRVKRQINGIVIVVVADFPLPVVVQVLGIRLRTHSILVTVSFGAINAAIIVFVALAVVGPIITLGILRIAVRIQMPELLLLFPYFQTGGIYTGQF